MRHEELQQFSHVNKKSLDQYVNFRENLKNCREDELNLMLTQVAEYKEPWKELLKDNIYIYMYGMRQREWY
ncbi:hypothetical protein E2562_034586 [Oryza meyeriana var. granulata]|uniref:Uncharacterized protein n=1 Tax=Oryza meyeriana var. granulata TaxID=110450 RepID=A0A6G1DS45_9ORYZ|nr:hypothetical protein E2562_034586 [Oryza meyeriana var. granulata]